VPVPRQAKYSSHSRRKPEPRRLKIARQCFRLSSVAACQDNGLGLRGRSDVGRVGRRRSPGDRVWLLDPFMHGRYICRVRPDSTGFCASCQWAGVDAALACVGATRHLCNLAVPAANLRMAPRRGARNGAGRSTGCDRNRKRRARPAEFVRSLGARCASTTGSSMPMAADRRCARLRAEYSADRSPPAGAGHYDDGAGRVTDRSDDHHGPTPWRHAGRMPP
jgi:hypothetical protein